MSIVRRKIEDRAIAAIETLIDQHPTMESKISKGDKDLSWDGSIRIYTDDNCAKDKANYEGDVPVQVKGHVDVGQSYIDQQRINYSVELEDLRNYYIQEGCLYFQVFISIDGTEKAIFYNCLYTSKIKGYLDEAKEKGNTKNITIPFVRLKPDCYVLAMLLRQFRHESAFMGSGRGQLVPKTIPASQLGTITRITATVYGGTTHDDLIIGMIRGDVVPYTPLCETGVSIPIQLPKEWMLSIKDHLNDEIKVGEQTYYSCYELEKVFSTTNSVDACEKIIVRPSLNVILTFHTEGLNIKLDIESDLVTLANDAHFLIALAEKECLSIGEMFFPMHGICFETNFLQAIREIAAMGDVALEIGLHDNTSFKDLNREAIEALRDLVMIKEKKKAVAHTAKSYMYHWKYKGKDYPVIIAEESESQNKIFNLMNHNLLKICFGKGNDEDGGCVLPNEENYVPSFITLKGEKLANLYYYDYESIFDQIENAAINTETDSILNDLALEFIRAYDICFDEHLLTAAKLILCRIMAAFPNAVHCQINLLQIEYREKGKISEEDTIMLNEQLNKASVDEQFNSKYVVENYSKDESQGFYLCALILLHRTKEAVTFMQGLPVEFRERVKYWPVYTLLEQQIAACRNEKNGDP